MKIKRLSVILVCLIIGCAHRQSVDGESRSPSAVGAGPLKDFIDLNPRDPASSITCQDFFGLLQSTQPAPTTIQQALQILRGRNPALFANYVLLPNSLSLHESSFRHPRAVVYGSDGEFVMSFNGHPSQAGYEHLEVMCFDPLRNIFDFREVTFKGDIKPASPTVGLPPFTISRQNGPPGRDCRQCHQNPARPNWDIYAGWPSAYGALDDLLFRRQEELERTKFMSPFDREYMAREHQAYQTFDRSTARYNLLTNNASIRPNNRFGKILTALNARRIVAEWVGLGGFTENLRQVARLLYCPPPYIEERSTGYISRPILTKWTPEAASVASESAGYSAEVDSRLADNFGLKPEPIQSSGDQELAAHYYSLGYTKAEARQLQGREVTTYARLAGLSKLFKKMGVDIRNWSMQLHGGYDFENGNGGDAGSTFNQMLDKPFLTTFFPKDERLHRLVGERRTVDNDPERVKALEAEICRHFQ